jgi:plastocyanin
MKSSRRPAALAALALAVATMMAGCSNEETDHLKALDGPIEGGNGITPTTLQANKGHKVEIQVTNTAKDKQHGFSIEGYDIHEVIDQGKTTTVEFKADKAGQFKVFCQLHETHKPSQLIVT